jgi:hypothetical protein
MKCILRYSYEGLYLDNLGVKRCSHNSPLVVLDVWAIKRY